MDAAMGLFAERGFEATSVGEIEKTAGLVPRSGALYTHFKGKDELLERAIERQLGAIDELGDAFEMLPLGDLRSELTLLARWNLASLDRRRDLVRFMRREGDRLPAHLRELLYERLIEIPYARITAWLRERLGERAEAVDLHAAALILIEPMASLRSIQWAFGRAPDDLDDERIIETWVAICLAYARSLGVDGSAETRATSAPAARRS
jgi:AcrR family transcriptional regulator